MVQSLHFDPKISNEVRFQPPHDKTNNMTCVPISLGICPVLSVFAVRSMGS